MTQKQAEKRLKEMTLQEMIDLWNDKVEMYEKTMLIGEMDDVEHWDFLGSELGGYELMRFIINSGETFHEPDDFVFCCSESEQVFSFSTKQGLLEVLDKEWFIQELMLQSQTINKYGRVWEEVEGVLLDDYWLVGNFEGIGQIYMDNVKGAVLLIDKDSKLWKSDI